MPRGRDPRTASARSVPARTDDGARARLLRNQRALRRAMMTAIGVGLGLDVVVILIALITAGRPQFYGALIGTALAAMVMVPTLIAVRMGEDWSPQGNAAGILGSWLLKMIIVIGGVVLVSRIDAVSSRWVGIALLVGAFLGLLTEVVLLARQKPRLEVAQRSDDS